MQRVWCCLLAAGVAGVVFSGPAGAQAKEEQESGRRPTLTLRATPAISFSPARIYVTAELRGGDDLEQFYCPAVEWDWGDGTKSESTTDCDPYEPGRSEIRRRYTTEHVYETGGRYRVQIRLKRNNKVIASGSTSVQVRPGVRDMSSQW